MKTIKSAITQCFEIRRKSQMRIGIYGYGNVARGVESAVLQNADAELVAVFTRRDPSTVKTVTGVKVYSTDDVSKFEDKIDIMILCGGSATDLPVTTPMMAKSFNVIDSFDTHACINEHFDNVDKAASDSGHIAVISGGWDPGMFSVLRLYSSSILPEGKDYTFWGKGVSQGHSDACRRIDGVIDARQYTIPVESAVEAVRSGKNPELSTSQKHKRLVYAVVENGADKNRIEKEIKSMPHYFDEYETTVNFISEEEMKKDHSELPHGGMVFRSGKTGFEREHDHIIEYDLKLDSNPEFTGSILVALARAAFKMYNRGDTGCKTIFDIAPADLSVMSAKELRSHLL